MRATRVRRWIISLALVAGLTGVFAVPLAGPAVGQYTPTFSGTPMFNNLAFGPSSFSTFGFPGFGSIFLVGQPVFLGTITTVTPVAPVVAQPVYSQPIYSQPIYSQPAYNAPIYTQPAYAYPGMGYTQPYSTLPSTQSSSGPQQQQEEQQQAVQGGGVVVTQQQQQQQQGGGGGYGYGSGSDQQEQQQQIS
jgi:hypothetical protein